MSSMRSTSRVSSDSSNASESYRYLSNDETEMDTNMASAEFADLTFLRHGAKILDNWEDSVNGESRYKQKLEAKQGHNDESDDEQDLADLTQSTANNITDHSANNITENSMIDGVNHSIVDSTVDSTINNSTELSPLVVKKANLDRKARRKSNGASKDKDNILHSTPLLNPTSKKNNHPESIMKKSESLTTRQQQPKDERKRNVSFLLKSSPGNYSLVSPTDAVPEPFLGSSSSPILDNESAENDSLDREIKNLENLLKKKQLQRKSKKPSTAINPETVPKLAETSRSGKTVYQTYELDSIDKLSPVEAQNVLKNICLKLQVPYSTLPTVIGNIPDILKSEHHLLDFANNVHKSIYLTEIKPPVLGDAGKKSKTAQKSKLNFLKCLNDMKNKIDLLVDFAKTA